jgi:serine/threonine protein kinase
MVGAMGSQIELLSVVHHKYLVSLLGYRCTRKQQVLVYEYLSGGDLRQRLQGANKLIPEPREVLYPST